jgi:hypothetical protein
MQTPHATEQPICPATCAKGSGIYRCFPPIQLFFLHIIFVSDYGESSHLKLDSLRGGYFHVP